MAKKRSKGLGDTIEKLTEVTGIKSVVEKLEEKFDFDCGCEERKKLLNKLFPYSKPNCLTEDEYNYLKNFNWDKSVLIPAEQAELLKIYNRVLNSTRGMTTCQSCWKEILNNLKNIYLTYEQDKV